jgi:hypothetical protein
MLLGATANRPVPLPFRRYKLYLAYPYEHITYQKKASNRYAIINRFESNIIETIYRAHAGHPQHRRI